MKSQKLLLLSLLPLSLGSTAFGQLTDKTWTGASNGGWGGGLNWSDGNATITGGNNLIFNSGANLADNWTGNFRTVGALTYGGSTDITTRLTTTDGTVGRGITFSSTAGDAEINISGSTNVLLTNNDVATNSDITLADNLVMNHTGTGTLTLDSKIVGTGDITINGTSLANTVIFDNAGTANTYTGDLLIDGGNLQVLNAGKLGNANNSITIRDGGQLHFTGASTVASTRSTTLANGDAYLRTDDGVSTTWNADIDGSGKFIKVGEGDINLLGANTFSGGLEVRDGRIFVNNSTGSGPASLGSGDITLNSDVETDTAAGATIFFQNPVGDSTLTNDIILTGNGGTLLVGGNTTTLSGVVSGTGDLRKNGGGTLSLTGAYALAGNLIIDASGAVNLGAAGTFTFDIGAAGVNNAIFQDTSAISAFTIDGDFIFDLADAGTGESDTWSIIGSTVLASTTFGTNFSVSDFTESSGVWSNGSYEFSELTGVLTVVPEPSTFALLGGLFALSWVMIRRR